MINLKKFLIDDLAQPLFFKNFPNYKKFIDKNKNKKKYYIITRSPGAGMFSNINYVLNHVKYANKKKLIPVIDMENFTTIYNEKLKIFKTFNAWEYYFNQISNINLKEIYKRRDFIFSKNENIKNFVNRLDTDKIIIKLFRNLKVKKYILREVKLFYKKKFKNEKNILGVHLRSTSYKKAKNHAFPPSPKIMCKEIDRLLKTNDYKKIFFVTEDENYAKYLKKRYPYNSFFYNSFRSNKNEAFKIYPRKFHRFKLGKEIIIETLLLSHCKGILSTISNISSAASMLAKNKITLHEINLGYNSSNKFIARWLWYFKNLLPEYLGGLKVKSRMIKKINFK